MQRDKYKAVWVSHSSIGDFLKCPRSYYLRSIYRDPITGNRITRMQPALALGQVVHEVLEGLSVLPVEERFLVSPISKLEAEWEKVSGKKGGFKTTEEEEEHKARGVEMIKRIMENPGPLARRAVKIKEGLPHYWLSEEEEIILCGKIDWLEYDEKSDSVKILDFKTGRRDEDESSLQLPIYYLLASNTQNRRVSGASYWYLGRDKSPKNQKLPGAAESYSKVFNEAKKIKLARQIEHFVCPKGPGGCMYCAGLEEIKRGKGELVGKSSMRQDIYIL